MFKGTVNIRSELEGKGLKFLQFEYKPTDPVAEKVEIEGPNGDHTPGRWTVRCRWICQRLTSRLSYCGVLASRRSNAT